MKQITLKSLLLSLLVLLGGGVPAWGEIKTITLDNIGAGLPTSPNTTLTTTSVAATEDNAGEFELNYLQGKKQGNSIFLAKGTGAFISNKTPIPGNIKDVAVYINSGAAVKTTYHCAFSTSECTALFTEGSTAVNISGGKNYTYTCNVNSAKYFCLSLGNANNGQVLKLVISYDDANTGSDIPSLNVNPTSIDFGTVATGSSVESQAVSVTMSNVEKVIAYFDGGKNSPFTVDKENLTASGEIVVSPKAETLATAGEYSDNLTITDGDNLTETVAVKLVVKDMQKYTVAWNVNGESYADGEPTTEVVEGEKVTALPSEPASIGSKVFVGWTTEALTGTQANAPSILFKNAADAPAVFANTTYYAVFAVEQKGTDYEKLTDASVLSTGDKIVFVGEKASKFYGMKAYDGSSNNYKAAEIAILDNTITDLGEACEFVLGGTVGAWTIFDGTYYTYSAGTKSRNYMKGKEAIDNECLWNITSDNETVSVVSVNNEDTPYMRFNDNIEKNLLFSCYASSSSQKTVTIYHKGTIYSNYSTTVETGSVTLRGQDGDAYYATFSSDRAVVFDESTTVYAVNVTDSKLALNEVEGRMVPANTGVLLKTAGTSATFTYIETAPAIEDNMLHASVTAGETEGSGDSRFYMLSYNKDGEKLGFYWGAAKGGKFTSKAGSAYLVVEQGTAAGVKGFSFSDMETGIGQVSNATSAQSGVVYDLQGRRVERAAHGLYIVNGRKVLVK